MGEEWNKIRDRLPKGSEVREENSAHFPSKLSGKKCAFATSTGCEVYNDRPLMCRMFGTVDTPPMTCMHGCKPKRRITERKGAEMTERYIMLNLQAESAK